MNKTEFKNIIEKHYSGNPNIHNFKVIEQEGCYVAKLDCGELDENDSFVDDEDDYVIIDKACNYFQITDVEPNGETEKLIREKAEQYNIEIEKVKLFENIKELNE